METNRNRAPTVQLDGEKIRAIRESKELTQLYVAEVVGVSVDTVSRWENNRTDGVRTENARSLAQALEVEFDQVLRVPTDKEQALTRRSLWPSVLLLLLVGLALVAGYGWFQTPPTAVQGVRLLPPYTPPGSQVPISIELRVVEGEPGRVVVRETLPAGWTLTGAVPKPDQGPTIGNVVKWIVPIGTERVQIVYLARTPVDAEESSAHRFSGELVTSGNGKARTAIDGEQRIDLEYVHWADEDADFSVDDGEVLKALERIEFAKELALDPADLRRLWGAEEYQWDPTTNEFTPLVPATR